MCRRVDRGRRRCTLSHVGGSAANIGARPPSAHAWCVAPSLTRRAAFAVLWNRFDICVTASVGHACAARSGRLNTVIDFQTSLSNTASCRSWAGLHLCKRASGFARLSAAMFGPTNSTMQRYEADLGEWKSICDGMDAAEARALAVLAPGPCELCQYWAQQCVALNCEMPCRLTYHSVCMSGSFVCCVSAPASIACDPNRAIWQHHALQIQELWWLVRLLAENLCVRPLTPWYVYHADVGLERPPKPAPPRGDFCEDCCENCVKCGTNDLCECECDCSCERMLYHVNRRLRSYLCTYSGAHACHPSQCFGPCPCILWQAPTLAPATEAAACESSGGEGAPRLEHQPSYQAWVRFGADGAGGGSKGATCPAGCCPCVIETQMARHLRWDREYDRAREARTAAFYERRNAVARGEPVAPEEADYMAFVPTGVAAAPEPINADEHCCEKAQGRLCALALMGTCCAGAYLGSVALHGGVLLVI